MTSPLASSETVYRDEGVATDAFGGGDGAPARPVITVPPGPSEFAKQANKLTNVVFSSFLVAFFRGWTTPADQLQPTPPNASSLPQWYLEEYRNKGRYKAMSRQVVRDTALLTGAAYVMEGVDAALSSIRGTSDVFNRVAGGMTAGGILGMAWFPTRAPSRLILTGTGAVVGFLSHTLETGSQTMLLEQQQRLEAEVLGCPPDQLRNTVDVQYLRELLRLRQKQLAEAAEALRKAGGGPLIAGQPSSGAFENGSRKPNGPTSNPGSGRLPTEGLGSPGATLPAWMGSGQQGAPGSSYQEGGPEAAGQGPAAWQSDAQDGSQASSASPGLSAAASRAAQAGEAWQGQQESRRGDGERRGGGWGGWFGRGRQAGQPGRESGGVPSGREMQIKEESDLEMEARELRENAAGSSMVIREEQDVRR